MKALYTYGLFLTFGFLALSLTAQSPNPQHEMGLRLTSLEDFGFVYKKKKEENKFHRYRLAFTNLGVRGQDGFSQFDLGLGLAVGIEKRSQIGEKLLFVRGLEPFANFNSTLREESAANQVRLQLGVGYVLGFMYELSDQFYVGVETIPSLSGMITAVEDQDATWNVNLGFNSNAVAFTIAYRFDSLKN